MTGMFDFIVEPFEGRYNNSKSIDGNTLILNTELQNHMYVSRIGKVIAEPAINNTCVKKNDLVVLHHNVFRRFRDIRGDEKNSKSYIKENMYLAGQDQLFAYKRADGWQALDGFCFVKPIKETKMFSINFEKPPGRDGGKGQSNELRVRGELNGKKDERSRAEEGGGRIGQV